MELPVLIEPVAGNGFRATTGDPFAAEGRGPTREEALRNLEQEIQRRLSAGAEIASVRVPPGEHPLARFAGMLKDEPLYDEWQQAIEEYRRKRDEDEF